MNIIVSLAIIHMYVIRNAVNIIVSLDIIHVYVTDFLWHSAREKLGYVSLIEVAVRLPLDCLRMQALGYFITTLVLAFTYWSAVSEACSCRPGFQNIPRNETIQTFYRSSRDIYTATVTRVNCKCYKTESDQTGGLLSCIQYTLDPQGTVQRNLSREYSCRSGDRFGPFFFACSSAANQIAREYKTST